MEGSERNEQTRTIFVDSDAFVALAKDDDSNHQRAQMILGKLNKRPITFFTSNYVFAETITVISQRIGHKQALSFIHAMKNPESQFSFRWVDEGIEELAIQIFNEQVSKNVSFVDCANMAIIRHDKLDGIFSFDSIYRKNNIKTAESLS